MTSDRAQLEVILRGDISQFQRAMRTGTQDVKRFEQAVGVSSVQVESFGQRAHSSLLAVTAGATAASAAGLALAMGVKSLTSAASDLAETQSKVNVVFGDQAGLFKAWGEGAASAMGMSKQAALENAATLGNFAQALGVSRAESVEMSKATVQLAADLASFNNASPEDVLLALRSGLSGETEPMRRFGVAINAATVEAKALELGLAATKNEITEGDKVMARYALIMEQTKTAQGDFARSANNQAAEAKTLKANIADLQAELGKNLLPATTAVQHEINQLLANNGKAWASDFATGVDGLVGVFGDLSTAIARVDGAMKAMGGLGIWDALKFGAETAIPGLRPLEAGVNWLLGRGEQAQLQRLAGNRAAGLTDAEVDPFGWTGTATKPAIETVLGTGTDAADALGVALGDTSKATDALGSRITGLGTSMRDLPLEGITSSMAGLTSQAQLLIQATEAAARAEADLLKQRQQAGISHINGLNRQGVTRYAPGVFETIAGAFGLNTDFGDAPLNVVPA